MQNLKLFITFALFKLMENIGVININLTIG